MLRQTRGGNVTSAKTDAVTAPLPVCVFLKSAGSASDSHGTQLVLEYFTETQFNVLMIYSVLHTVCFKALQIINLRAHDAVLLQVKAPKGTNLC